MTPTTFSLLVHPLLSFPGTSGTQSASLAPVSLPTATLDTDAQPVVMLTEEEAARYGFGAPLPV
jgi:hypothetical protein